MAFEAYETKNISQIAPAVLRWYGKNARALPWRVGPRDQKMARQSGGKPDPYHVWLSEIMLQQTTVATVGPRYAQFLKRWPDVNQMAAAPLDDVLGQWAGLGYYARARNLHKCAVVVAREQGGEFPDTEEALIKLPGVGAYTAAAIAAIAFDRRAVVVDGNIERVIARLFAIATPLPAARPEIKTRAALLWPKKRSGDFAQGLMDLGAAVCKARAPLCGACPISSLCDAYALGAPAEFPKKAPKKSKPKRTGAAFVLTNTKGEMLFERRPEKGLLGGMLGLPGTAWMEKGVGDVFAHAPAKVEKAKWARTGAVIHIFTHFHLTLDVYVALAPRGFRRAADQYWLTPTTARLPTVMKKAVELVLREEEDK